MERYADDPEREAPRSRVPIRIPFFLVAAVGAVVINWAVPASIEKCKESRNQKSAQSLWSVLRLRTADDRGPISVSSGEPGQEAFLALMVTLEGKGYLDSPEALFWIDGRTGERLPWILVPGNLGETSFSRGPLLISPRPTASGRWIVAYSGGQVVVERAESWRDFLEDSDPERPDPVTGDP